MTDELDRYVKQELAALREDLNTRTGKEAVGDRLGVSRDHVYDPHVARLLEGVAYLGARVQARLDDEFPELTDSLLNILYPQLLLPFPSCLMVQLVPKADLAAAALAPRDTPLTVERASAGVKCRYSTVSPIDVWPIRLEAASASLEPLPTLRNPLAEGAKACIQLTLRCLDPHMTFEDLMRMNPDRNGLGRLRLQLLGRFARELYQLLCTSVVSVVYADGTDDRRPVCLGADAVSQGGFDEGDALVPWPSHGAAGYRHLLEYFAFPEKFLCIDLAGADRTVLRGRGNTLQVFIYLRDLPAELERGITADSFGLFCTPAVNLFLHRCEAVTLDEARTEYPVDPTRSEMNGVEVWSIEDVRETLPDGSVRPWSRLFGSRRRSAGPEYDIARRPARGGIAGDEVWLRVVDPKASPERASRNLLAIRAKCINRDLPAALSSEGLDVRAERNLIGVSAVRPLSGATATGRRPERDLRDPGASAARAAPGSAQRDWHLVSHLAMNHLPLGSGSLGAQVLQETIATYDMRQSNETRTAIGSLVAVSSRPSTARLPDAQRGVFCRGLDVTLEFNARTWRGSQFLFAAVLDRFFAAQARANSFVRTIVKLQGQPDPVIRWPARSDSRVLP